MRCQASHRLRLYAEAAVDRIPDYADLRRAEGEKDEQQRKDPKENLRYFGRAAAQCLGVKTSRFVQVCSGGGNEKYSDIDPVRRAADHAVVGVKKDGNEGKSQKDATQLDPPKILVLAKENGLYYSEKQHWPEEQLHVLPGGFVDAGKGRDEGGFVRPII